MLTQTRSEDSHVREQATQSTGAFISHMEPVTKIGNENSTSKAFLEHGNIEVQNAGEIDSLTLFAELICLKLQRRPAFLVRGLGL
jgi:hypothetical protein